MVTRFFSIKWQLECIKNDKVNEESRKKIQDEKEFLRNYLKPSYDEMTDQFKIYYEELTAFKTLIKQ
jgi:hypothetical protein